MAIRYLTAGESHGKSLTVIVEGVQKVRAGMTVAPQPFQAAPVKKKSET